MSAKKTKTEEEIDVHQRSVFDLICLGAVCSDHSWVDVTLMNLEAWFKEQWRDYIWEEWGCASAPGCIQKQR